MIFKRSFNCLNRCNARADGVAGIVSRSVAASRVGLRAFTAVANPSDADPIRRHVDFVTKESGWGPDKYNLVPFVKEPLRSVLNEVPDFKYYVIGDDDPKPYPYKDVPLDQPIPISEDKPHVLTPPNKELQFSRLENGLRIVSLDKGGYVSNLGLFIHAGSRYETPESFGCSQYIQHMAYQATAHLSWLRTIKTIEHLGINANCTAGREHMIYQAEMERKFVPLMIPLMTGNVVFPRFLSWDVDRKSKEFVEERDKFDNNVEAQMTEWLHMTAWKNNTLGNRLQPHIRHKHNYTGEAMRAFMLQHFSPNNMVMIGVNVDHAELTKWTMRAFVDYEAIPPRDREETKAQYTGGETRIDSNIPLCHLAVAFETPGGWNSEDLVPLTVLQMILGGGGSFSTGGPGKGMHARLYREVLSTNWADSCIAFSTQYTDSGLFGIYITGHPKYAGNMGMLLTEQFRKMGTVTTEELNRAKNGLKSSIWMNLENRSVVMEDIGRQLLMSGKVLSGAELCAKVDKVTPADIQRAVERLLATPPTVVANGDIANCPTRQEIIDALRK